MTHRSRNGGPPPRPKSAKVKTKKKLHHPPPSSNLDPPDHSSPISESDSDSEAEISSLSLNPTDSEILKLIHTSLEPTLNSPSFLPTIQTIKGLLYDRKWLEVFNNPKIGDGNHMLEVYAGRWVPSRTLCFREMLGSLKVFHRVLAENNVEGSSKPSRKGKERAGFFHVLSLGGGAGSELIAVAALIKAIIENMSSDDVLIETGIEDKSRPKFKWTGIDIGDWKSTLSKFITHLRQDWNLPSNLLEIEYIRGNLLSNSDFNLLEILQKSPADLTTLLFTLTELLQQSRASTISLLDLLTKHSPIGSYLLVADSASDISEFSIGESGRKWPVWMVVDALLGVGPAGLVVGGDRKGCWEVVKSVDSCWFRLGEGVGSGWECKLENVRYWMRLYRRV